MTSPTNCPPDISESCETVMLGRQAGKPFTPTTAGVPSSRAEIFRAEALQHHHQADFYGEVLLISPAWVRWAGWVVAAAVVLPLAFAILGSTHEYATGPAILRVDDRVDVRARSSESVSVLNVAPGIRVKRGDILLRFYAAPEEAAVERAEHEFQLQLVASLRDPGDQGARQALVRLRVERDYANARMDERTVRAPTDGIVSEVRIRVGQHLTPGDIVVTVTPERPSISVIAVLPGSYRPQLHAGMTMRWEPQGYRYAYQDVVVDWVSDDVIGPQEAKRFVGEAIADAVIVEGAVVLVRGRLASTRFRSEGERYLFHDGMTGRAEARVRKVPIILMLVPALHALREGLDG
jgi:HlyD family secretion protein